MSNRKLRGVLVLLYFTWLLDFTDDNLKNCSVSLAKTASDQTGLQPYFLTLNLQTLWLRYYARFITVDRPLSRHDERVGFQKGKEGKVATTRILAHNLVPTWYKISPFFALPTLIFVIAWFQQYFMMIIITMKHGKILV